MSSDGENFLRIIPMEEILEIENYLYWLKYWRRYISSHLNLMEAIGDIDGPVQLWEYEVSASLREDGDRKFFAQIKEPKNVSGQSGSGETRV